MRTPDSRRATWAVTAFVVAVRLSYEGFFVALAALLAYVFRRPAWLFGALVRAASAASFFAQAAMLTAFPIVCWAYGAGVVFSMFVTVVFWGFPAVLLAEEVAARTLAVTPAKLFRPTRAALERMAGCCPICWGALAADSTVEEAGEAGDGWVPDDVSGATGTGGGAASSSAAVSSGGDAAAARTRVDGGAGHSSAPGELNAEGAGGSRLGTSSADDKLGDAGPAVAQSVLAAAEGQTATQLPRADTSEPSAMASAQAAGDAPSTSAPAAAPVDEPCVGSADSAAQAASTHALTQAASDTRVEAGAGGAPHAGLAALQQLRTSLSINGSGSAPLDADAADPGAPGPDPLRNRGLASNTASNSASTAERQRSARGTAVPRCESGKEQRLRRLASFPVQLSPPASPAAPAATSVAAGDADAATAASEQPRDASAAPSNSPGQAGMGMHAASSASPANAPPAPLQPESDGACCLGAGSSDARSVFDAPPQPGAPLRSASDASVASSIFSPRLPHPPAHVAPSAATAAAGRSTASVAAATSGAGAAGSAARTHAAMLHAHRRGDQATHAARAQPRDGQGLLRTQAVRRPRVTSIHSRSSSRALPDVAAQPSTSAVRTSASAQSAADSPQREGGHTSPGNRSHANGQTDAAAPTGAAARRGASADGARHRRAPARAAPSSARRRKSSSGPLGCPPIDPAQCAGATPVVLACGHTFHFACAADWFSQCLLSGRATTCPNCQGATATQTRFLPRLLFTPATRRGADDDDEALGGDEVRDQFTTRVLQQLTRG